MDVKIHSSWKTHLTGEFEKPYFAELAAFVKKEYQSEVVYPSPKYIFRAFDLTPFEEVKIVILGQDPYHGPRQANGLCFAVAEGMRLPPSLQNIFKEIRDEFDLPDEALHARRSLGEVGAKSGDLTRWATQGVLLLNATLTVRAHLAGSHQHKGWEEFTDAAIVALAREREGLVFMLWGNYAKKKGGSIDRTKHLVLESAHPSPFAAHSGFFGNGHFKKANEYLKQHGKEPIDWL